MTLRTFVCTTAFVAAWALPTAAMAQSTADKNKAKAYYFSAQQAYEGGNYSEALSNLKQAENLVGDSGYYIMLRAKTYYKKGDYREAKLEMDKFYASEPPEAMQREMAPILIGIDEQLEAQRAAEAKRAADKREAERIAELSRPEKQKKAAILGKKGGLFRTVDYDGRNGKDGRHGLDRGNRDIDRAGESGGNGGSGASVSIYVEQVPFEYIPDLARVTFFDGTKGKWSQYWDLSESITLDVSGGNGGDGGDGGLGRTGNMGQNEAGYSAAANGQRGGIGGRGGDAGKGGNGGSATFYILGDSSFLTEVKKKISVNTAAGSPGERGRGGDGGKGGIGGSTYTMNGWVQGRTGPRGDRGARGQNANAGRKGSVTWQTVSRDYFIQQGIQLH